jgi:hypothetical protein
MLWHQTSPSSQNHPVNAVSRLALDRYFPPAKSANCTQPVEEFPHKKYELGISEGRLMPSRMLVGEAIWGSDKIAKCTTKIPATVGVYYAWFYMLADANGSFEITNPRAVHAKVAVNLPFLTWKHVEKILSEFEKEGLLFTWEDSGKRYGHWTGSQIEGRTPPPSQKRRYVMLAPEVPKENLDRYQSTYSKGIRMHVRTASGVSQAPDLGLVLGLDLVRDKANTTRETGAQNQLQPQNPRLVIPSSDYENTENKKPTPQQIEYAKVSKLILGALGIVARAKAMNKSVQSADCREELKNWAAKNGLEYDSMMVSKALDVAEEKSKAVNRG